MAASLENLKATKIPDEVLLRHLRLVPEYTDDVELAGVHLIYRAAISFICEAYAVSEDYLDEHSDMAIATLALTRDFYDNPKLTVDRNYTNRCVQAVMDAHNFNLL